MADSTIDVLRELAESFQHQADAVPERDREHGFGYAYRIVSLRHADQVRQKLDELEVNDASES